MPRHNGQRGGGNHQQHSNKDQANRLGLAGKWSVRHTISLKQNDLDSLILTMLSGFGLKQ